MSNSPKPFDPKLKTAMEEIKAILEKHQIAGAITLASPTHAEFRNHIPKWACASIDEETGRVSVYSQREHYKSDAEQKENIDATLHILCQIRDVAGQVYMGYNGLINEIKKQIDFDHKPFYGFTPHKPGGDNNG